MKKGLDSRPPTDAQIAAAKAAGYDVWALYHGSPGDGIDPAHLASDADFDRVRKAGLGTLAYVSGNENPRAIQAWSQATGVPTAVDCERFIREDGPWVPGWLAESGSGLYGNGSVHYDSSGFRKAAFHIFAGYYGYDPRETWPNWLPHDATPTAWQFQGTTDLFGIAVDLNWFDDAFAALFGSGAGHLGDDFMALIDNPTDAEKAAFKALLDEWQNLYTNVFSPLARFLASMQLTAPADYTQSRSQTVDAIKAELDALKVQIANLPPGSVDLTPVTNGLVQLQQKLSNLTLKSQ